LAAGKKLFEIGDVFGLVRFHTHDHLPAMTRTKRDDLFRL
jgi:hypothetical protein